MSELEEEVPLRLQKSKKKNVPLNGIWWIGQALF